MRPRKGKHARAPAAAPQTGSGEPKARHLDMSLEY
jgi:hypothetical protein